MGKKNSSFIYLFLIVILSAVIRLLLPVILFRSGSKYSFIGSYIPYFQDADSYFYARLLQPYLPKIVLYIVPLSCTLIALCFLYFIIESTTSNKNISFWLTLFISFFPYFYNQTALGIIDTPPLIVMCILGMIFFYSKLFDNKLGTKAHLISFSCIVLFATLLYTVWDRPIFFLLLILAAYFQFADNIWLILSGILGSSIMAFILSSEVRHYLSLKVFGVLEYTTPSYIVYYIIALAAICYGIYLYYKNHGTNKIIKFYVALTIIFFTLSLFLGRFSIFAIIFSIIILSYLAKNIQPYLTQVIIALMICNLLIMGFDYYREPIMIDNNFENAMQHITEDKVIISLWDYGHAIYYFSGHEPLYLAEPTKDAMDTYCYGLMKYGFKNINYPTFYVVVHKQDYDKCTGYFVRVPDTYTPTQFNVTLTTLYKSDTVTVLKGHLA